MVAWHGSISHMPSCVQLAEFCFKCGELWKSGKKMCQCGLYDGRSRNGGAGAAPAAAAAADLFRRLVITRCCGISFLHICRSQLNLLICCARLRKYSSQRFREPQSQSLYSHTTEPEWRRRHPMYKRSICRFWERDCCRYGDACTFAHGRADQRGGTSDDCEDFEDFAYDSDISGCSYE